MADFNLYNNYGTGTGTPTGQYGQSRKPGARREKMKGYLRAANELRQSYQNQLSQNLQGEEEQVPGSFSDVEIVRSGEEELLLFPSYARKHVKRKRHSDDWARGRDRGMPGSRENIDRPHPDPNQGLVSSGDADYWRRQWEMYEDANAVVDVDVRGWIYSPQKGPLTRKNRLLLAVARRLSGIPAPNQQDEGGYHSRDNSPHPAGRRHAVSASGEASKHEEMAAAKEAENIARRGQEEADAAAKGKYTAESTGMGNGSGTVSPGSTSRSSSPRALGRQHTGNSTDSELGNDEDPGIRALSKRSSWHDPAHMSRDELIRSNELLMMRLRPFMTTALANTTITVFFFNDSKSTSKSVTTNDSGHFNVRAALDFVPTQVRVLASENLSATEAVIITESQGISLISDIDDTIKHSAISHGAREIFKNTFIRQLEDLTIKGVREWYSKLASMGVKLHYVSNSPWQLFPLLKSYFALSGLPPGSFHLKAYSGMLQGIFEPAAERKKGSIDRIMNDFPDRKFVLVGDSGEADLEVYTDAVLANPGRVLAVFIRDVTSPNKHAFFDQSIFSQRSDPIQDAWSSQWRDPSDEVMKRPALPERPNTDFGKVETVQQEDLIDFSDEPETASLHETKATSYSGDLQQLADKRSVGNHGEPPSKPVKPSNLRNFTNSPTTATGHDRANENSNRPQSREGKPLPPPKPRRSSLSVDMSQASTGPPDNRVPFSSSAQNRGPGEGSGARNSTGGNMGSRPQPPHRTNTGTSFRSNHSTNQEEGYVAAARRHVNTAYNALPAMRSQSPPSADRSTSPGSAAPPVPPRRGITAYPVAAARWATGATGGDAAAGGDGGAPGEPYNKKLEMWRRRWARAEEIMRSKGVVLKSWRVGGDVMGECVRLVEKAQMDIARPRRGGLSSV